MWNWLPREKKSEWNKKNQQTFCTKMLLLSLCEFHFERFCPGFFFVHILFSCWLGKCSHSSRWKWLKDYKELPGISQFSICRFYYVFYIEHMQFKQTTDDMGEWQTKKEKLAQRLKIPVHVMVLKWRKFAYTRRSARSKCVYVWVRACLRHLAVIPSSAKLVNPLFNLFHSC